jgi:hypothetical protein
MASDPAHPQVRGTIIIDGYNFLWRAVGSPAGALEGERRHLETQLLVFLRRCPEARIVLVYDGAAVGPVQGGAARHDRLDIVFSRPPQKADDLVLELSERLRDRGPVTVVSSDRKDIVRRLSGDRVRHFSSEGFGIFLEDFLASGSRALGAGAALDRKSEPSAGEAEAKRAAPDAGEVDEWLQAFAAPKPPAPGKGRGAPPAPPAPEPPEAAAGGKPPPPASEDVEEWLRWFSEPPPRSDSERS